MSENRPDIWNRQRTDPWCIKCKQDLHSRDGIWVNRRGNRQCVKGGTHKMVGQRD